MPDAEVGEVAQAQADGRDGRESLFGDDDGLPADVLAGEDGAGAAAGPSGLPRRYVLVTAPFLGGIVGGALERGFVGASRGIGGIRREIDDVTFILARQGPRGVVLFG